MDSIWKNIMMNKKYAKICNKICKICRSPYLAYFAYTCTPHLIDDSDRRWHRRPGWLDSAHCHRPGGPPRRAAAGRGSYWARDAAGTPRHWQAGLTLEGGKVEAWVTVPGPRRAGSPESTQPGFTFSAPVGLPSLSATLAGRPRWRLTAAAWAWLRSCGPGGSCRGRPSGNRRLPAWVRPVNLPVQSEYSAGYPASCSH